MFKVVLQVALSGYGVVVTGVGGASINSCAGVILNSCQVLGSRLCFEGC